MTDVKENKPRKSRASATKPKVATIIAHKHFKDGDPLSDEQLSQQGDDISAIEKANRLAVKEADKHERITFETHRHLFDDFGNRI